MHPPDPTSWLDRHGDAMFRYAMLRLGDRDLASDAVQDALLAAVAASATFRGDARERTWLIGILRHKVLDAIRRRARERPAANAPPDDRPTFVDGFWAHRQAPWGALPDDPLERSELRALLISRVAALPEAMREALVLREIDGLATDEVCKILNITPTNLWTLVHRAKVRLRRDLTEQWFERDQPPRGGAES